MVTNLWPRFLAHPVEAYIAYNKASFGKIGTEGSCIFDAVMTVIDW